MPKQPTKFKIKRGAEGDYYWNASKCGRIKADGGEGYKRRATLMRSLRRLLDDIKNGNWIVE